MAPDPVIRPPAAVPLVQAYPALRLLAGLLLAFGIAAGLGLWLTQVSVDRPLGVVSLRSGPWSGDVGAGSLHADPYSRALVARRGVAPLPSSDGIALFARTDSSGVTLEGRCDYRLEGELPDARIWTLAVTDVEGFPIANVADRFGLGSTAMVRPAGERTTVTLAPSVRAGNWLPTPERGPFVLALRLYEPAGTLVADAPPALPALRRLGCR
jgi:hypothetical protein